MEPNRWRVLEPLLDEALDLSQDEREAWLERLGLQHPDLAQDLTAILSTQTAADRSGFLLEQPDVTLAGLEVGAYRLERPLGQGGMGTVWLARRIDGRFEGVAAVKLLNLSLVTPTGLGRFRREGSTLSRLAHPGIARLLDAGVTASGQPFLILEHVDGQAIDAYVRAHDLLPAQKVRLFSQVLAAVAHAHANLIVHRDIKPSNILVTADGSVKLLDFGIAKLLDDDGVGERSSLTAEGAGALTPKYAAPEQLRGDPVTTATDVYSLGVLLYVMLSNRHPTAEGSHTPAETVRALFEVEPGPLPLGDLGNIVLKALHKKPSDRYQSVTAFAEDLERFLRKEPVSARRASPVYRIGKFVGRNRAAVSAAGLTVIGLVAATIFSIGQMKEAEHQRDAAIRNAKLSGAMTELQALIAGGSRGPYGRLLGLQGRIALAERVLTRQFQSEPWLVVQLMANLASRLPEADDYAGGRAMLERARAIAVGNDLPLEAASVDCALAYSLAYENLLDSARAVLSGAKGTLARVGAEVRPDIREGCLGAEGFFLLRAGMGDSGIALLRQVVAMNQENEVGLNRLRAHNNLGEALRLTERKREAATYFRAAVAALDTMGYGESEVMGNAVMYLTTTLAELGEFRAVDSVMAPIVGRFEAKYGPGQVSTLLAFLYGQGKLRLGDLDSAALWIGRAMRDTTEGTGGIAAWLPATVAQLRLEQERVPEAAAATEQLPGGLRGRRATAAMLRGWVLRAGGDAPAGSALLEEELDSLVNDGGILLTQFALPFILAGEWRLEAGDARAADSMAVLGLAAAVGTDSLTSRRGALAGRAELLRARALVRLKHEDAAVAALDRALPALINGYGRSRPFAVAAQVLRDSLQR